MALKATICKAQLQVTDLDRDYYQAHALTIARHPSENDARMMFRVVAFALSASDTLEFTRGISTEDEPDIWQKNLRGEIELWIELGEPDEKRLRKACGRSRRVILYTYKDRSAAVWWAQAGPKLERFNNLSVVHLAADHAALEQLADRNMELQCTVQDGNIWLSSDRADTEIQARIMKEAAG